MKEHIGNALSVLFLGVIAVATMNFMFATTPMSTQQLRWFVVTSGSVVLIASGLTGILSFIGILDIEIRVITNHDGEYLKNLGMLLLFIFGAAMCVASLVALLIWSSPDMCLPVGPQP